MHSKETRHFYFWVLTTIIASTGVILFFPFLFFSQSGEDNNIARNIAAQGSRLADVLRDSSLLQLSHACVVAGVIPMSLETILDIHLRVQNGIDINTNHRLVLLFLIVPSILYLMFRTSAFMPGLYVVLLLCQNLVIPAYIMISAQQEIFTVSKLVVPYGFLLAYILFSLRCILEGYEVLLDVPINSLKLGGTNVFSILAWIFSFLSSTWWLYQKCIQCRRLSPRVEMTDGEYLAYVYSAICIAASLAVVICNYVFGATSWKNVSEANLVSYVFIQFAANVIIIVLPGRVARMRAYTNIEVNFIKQVFVRYVSHEIRSPLNVVHASIELLKDYLAALSISDAALTDLIDDAYKSSLAAINILSNLLNFENIDAGTFKLDTAWKPLAGVFEGQLKWAEVLSAAKSINISIVDDSIATEAGMRKYRPKDYSEADVGDLEEKNDPLHKAPFADSVLLIDEFRIEEVMRILINNAIAFTPSNGSISIKMSTRAGSIPSMNNDNITGIFRFSVHDSGLKADVVAMQQLLGGSQSFSKVQLKGGGGREMGLWISHRVISMHQGRLGFLPGEGSEGNTFYFDLPLYSRSSSGFNELQSTERGRERSPGLRSLNIITNSETPHVGLDGNSVSPILSPVPLFPGVLRQSGSQIWPEVEASCPGSDSSLVAVVGSNSPESTELDEHNITRKQETPIQSDMVLTDIPDELEFSLRILIVDDSELNRKIVRRIIQSCGQFHRASITEADDGLTAVEALKSALQSQSTSSLSNSGHQPFDFVLMDYTMLEMDGPEAAVIFRRDFNFRGAIIGITGNALPADVDKYIACGANEVIIKPITKNKLIQCLLSYLNM